MPAAGKGARFGSNFKLLADVGRAPLIERTIRSLFDAGVTNVVVVVAADSPLTVSSLPVLADPRVRVVVNADPSRGMFSSIQAGIRVSEPGAPCLVLPGDMPFVTPRSVAAVAAAAAQSGRIVTPRYEGRRGHPIAIPASIRAELERADPRGALNLLLASHDRPDSWIDVDVTDRGILRDVDVTSDL